MPGDDTQPPPMPCGSPDGQKVLQALVASRNEAKKQEYDQCTLHIRMLLSKHEAAAKARAQTLLLTWVESIVKSPKVQPPTTVSIQPEGVGKALCVSVVVTLACTSGGSPLVLVNKLRARSANSFSPRTYDSVAGDLAALDVDFVHDIRVVSDGDDGELDPVDAAIPGQLPLLAGSELGSAVSRLRVESDTVEFKVCENG